jgi:nucleotide-binding universal stress UspA family protein
MSLNVIACIDDSRYAEAVCDYAAWSAQRMAAPLTLLHALDEPHGEGRKNLSGSIGFGAQEALLQELALLDEKRAKIAMEQGKHLLAAARERILALGIQNIETRQRHGDLLSTLKDIEAEIRMLVIGKRGADTESAHGHIGSHVENVIRALHKPILIAQQTFIPPKNFMLAFDGSATTRKGVDMIAASPLLRNLPCHLVMVGNEDDTLRASLTEAEQQLRDAGFTTHAAIIPGDPEVVLVEYQQRKTIDLMVMGAYGHSRIRHMIVGSTTTAMIRKSRISLMILR